jgi:hypothetical protein
MEMREKEGNGYLKKSNGINVKKELHILKLNINVKMLEILFINRKTLKIDIILVHKV